MIYGKVLQEAMQCGREETQELLLQVIEGEGGGA